jgi:hypothetical protein
MLVDFDLFLEASKLINTSMHNIAVGRRIGRNMDPKLRELSGDRRETFRWYRSLSSDLPSGQRQCLLYVLILAEAAVHEV